MENGINVLSTFDGMSCGMIALQRAGIEVKNYVASEIDKYAIKVSKSNYPRIIQVGDVSKVHYTNIGIEVDLGISMRVLGLNIDLIIGGSPCQGFSFAGKQLNFNDPRSKLFFEFVRLLNEIKLTNPDVKFLLENVNMKKEYQDVISNILGVGPVRINSEIHSPAKRDRLYWTNIDFDKNIPILDVKLQSILENGYADVNKSYCIDANYFKGGSVRNYVEKKRRQLVMRQSERRICVTTGLDEVRKLTPIECERCLCLPDNYTNHVSNTQRYKMIGNGWNINTLSHIFKGLR